MSDTTQTPPSDEYASDADEAARESAAGEQNEQPLTTSPDPADHTDTSEAPVLPPDYRPVSASDHVAPEPEMPRAEEPVPEPAAEEEPVAEAPAPVVDAEPVVAEPVVASTVATEQPAPAAEPYEAPAATAPAEPTPSAYAGPTYIQTPTAPAKHSNRGLGILIAVLAAVVFAAADIAVTYGILLAHYGDTHATDYLETYVKDWEFWVPLAVFTGAFIALVAIVNRGRWWGYVLGSIFVAALVFAGFYGGALLDTKAWNFTPGEFADFTRAYFQSNITYLWVATAVSVVALEAVTWFGAWIAFHGQKAKRKKAEARAAYAAELEASTR